MSMRNTNRLLVLSALVALTCATTTATAQSARPIAFTNARIHTASGKTIENGTLVIKNGKIEAVGKDVVVPAGAKIVDATGKTIMPGLVSAWSSAGLRPPTPRSNTPQRGRGGRRFRPSRGGSSGGATSNKAATKVLDGIYTRQPIFGKLLEVGITSLALTPQGGGFPGLGAVLNPAGKTRDDLALNDEAFVQIGMQRNAGAKKLLKDMFAKAKKVVEERENPPAPKKPAKKPEAAKPTGKPAAKPTEKPAAKPKEGKEPPIPKPAPKPTPKPTPKPAPKGGETKQGPKAAAPAKKAPPKKPKDPNVEIIADLLQGKRRAMVQISSAADLLHWRTAVDDDVKFPRMVVVTRHDSNSGTIDMVADHLKNWDCSVLLPAALSSLPRTQHLTHPAKKLHDAGIEIGFAIGESPPAVRNIFFSLMELVRAGLPADIAIKAVTHVPAKALGIDKRTGTIEVGKDADLLLFSGDPLSPIGKLEQVWLRGSRVESKK
jgi:hypothetical protein